MVAELGGNAAVYTVQLIAPNKELSNFQAPVIFRFIFGKKTNDFFVTRS